MNTLSLKCIRLLIGISILASNFVAFPATEDGWLKDDVLGWCYPATVDANTWTLFLGMGWYYHIPGEHGDWLWSTADRWCYTNAVFHPWFWLEVKDVWRRLDYDAYFQNLQPDVAMETVLKEFGEDDADSDDMLVYETNSGRYELMFVDGILNLGRLHYTNEDYPYRRFYGTYGSDTPVEITEREEWLAAGNFKVIPDWSGHRVIYTSSYTGVLLSLSEGYVRIENIISLMGAVGYLADKVALVSVIRDGQEEVLYRAFDVWETLRDSYTLSEAEQSQAAIIAKIKAGEEILLDGSTPLLWVANAGSGIPYKFYYIPEGLIRIVAYSGFDSALLMKPGYPGRVSLKEWALAQ